MISTLRALSDLISAAVDQIEQRCILESIEFPSLDGLFTLDSEKTRREPDIAKAISVIVAAASQLVVTVREPSVTMINTACGFHVSAALQTVLVTSVVECLRPHGTSGLHIHQIAKATQMDENKLGRLLRLLCSYHIFREVTPDVFSNNRLSSFLDTGKDFEEVYRQDSRHDGTGGSAALIEHFTDEVFKGSAHMADNLLDQATSHSDLPTLTALNRAFASDVDPFAWFEQPNNQYRLRRFGAAMRTAASVNPSGVILQGFPWAELPKKSVVVDVGGGEGALTLTLYNAYPDLRYVVQDRSSVIPGSIKYWENKAPLGLTSQQVRLQVHDFTTPQPIKDASVFLLCKILHDWSDRLAIPILRHLRNAATPETKLVVVDHIIPYACLDTSPNQTIPGAMVPAAPYPLLANMGQASARAYLTDIQMLVAFNAQERTLGHFVELFRKSGWSLVRVYGSHSFGMKQLVALPGPVLES
ncbi:O-methyltransferase [Hysterangium stoloniferum]|nr:O-methyltransferase [Hysterangium stoloniferum]